MTRKIFDSDGRVEFDEGIYFYEEDTIKLNYKFYGDTKTTIHFSHINPGVGIILEKVNAATGRPSGESISIVLQKDQYFIIEKSLTGTQNILSQGARNIPVPSSSSSLTVDKNKDYISVNNEKEEIVRFRIPFLLTQYYFHIYSVQENTVNQVRIENNAPSLWATNVKGSDGGRIRFERNTVIFENCKTGGEIEHHDIFLEKGTYYLSYIESGEPVEPVVFLSDGRNFTDNKKNILNEINAFILSEPSEVTLRIKGRNATVKNISIKEDIDGDYVETSGEEKKSDGSSIKIRLDEVLRVRWTSAIEKADFDDLNNSLHAVAETSQISYSVKDVGIDLEEEYKYEFDRQEMTLKISKGEAEVITLNIPAGSHEKYLTVFRNVSGYIKNFIVTKLDGEDKDILVGKTEKVLLPESDGSPVIVVGEDGEPYDLSSSYRILKEDNSVWFTNWEREYFESSSEIFLESRVSEVPGSLIVYGIHDNETNWDNLLLIDKQNDNIYELSKTFEIIDPLDFNFSPDNQVIDFVDAVVEKFDYFIVDYLKERSYTVNHNREAKAIELDISIYKKEKVKIHYGQGEFGEKSNLAVIDTGSYFPNNNAYLVLKRKE